MSFERLKVAIANQTVVSKLNTLKTTGLDLLVSMGDITEAEKTALIPIIDARIAELGV